MNHLTLPFFRGGASLVLLCLCACATTPPQSPTLPANTALPQGSVVLMDPTTDDGMLPALGESLSKGAVTIYNLDGPGAPLPVRSAPVVSGQTSVVTPGAYSGGGALGVLSPAVQLRPPTGTASPTANDDARVTVFNLETGMPSTEVQAPQIFTPPPPPPALLPPVTTGKPLASPFTQNAAPAASLPDDGPISLSNTDMPAKSSKGVKTKPSEPKVPGQPRLPDGSTDDVYKGPVSSLGYVSAVTSTPSFTGTTTLGDGSRAVQATDLMPEVTTPPASSRPPKGMTY